MNDEDQRQRRSSLHALLINTDCPNIDVLEDTEQDLMRQFKSFSVMTRGRGLTDSTLTKWIHSFPQCISICEGLEKLANIHTTSSE